MTMVTSVTGQTQTLSLNNKMNKHNVNHLRNVSFSSYLTSEDEELVRRLGESRRITGDGEIGVFGAERYFSGDMDCDLKVVLHSPRTANSDRTQKRGESRNDDLVHASPKTHPRTPSSRSESSWNSQRALLQSVLRNSSQRKTGEVRGKSFFANLGCKCSCCDKESIGVNENRVGEISFKKTSNPDPCSSVTTPLSGKAKVEELKISPDMEHKSSSGSWKDEPCLGLSKEKGFQFPLPCSVPGDLPVIEEIKSRKSIEVFGTPVQEKRNMNSPSIGQRPTMLALDATPGVQDIPGFLASGNDYNGNESDASSDLFEIDSLTGRVNPFLARQGSDATSGCATPTACYAPSEASIEWSVVTASAADFSITSDFEAFMNTKANKANKENLKSRPSILMGCKNQKSVRVARDAYKTSNENKAKYETRTPRVSHSYSARFPYEDKTTGFYSSRTSQRKSLESQSFSGKRSPPSSCVLGIQ